MKIRDILGKESIVVNLQVSNKDELLDKMLELAAKSGKVINLEAAKADVLERERVLSTGVGKGIAMPHAKTNAIKETTSSLATLKPPLDYDSLDGNPVDIVFLLLGKENDVGNHLRLLSKISRYLNQESFRSRLKECSDTDEAIELFSESGKNE